MTLRARAVNQDGSILSPLPDARVASLTMHLDQPSEATLRVPVGSARSLTIGLGKEVHIYPDGATVPLEMLLPWTARAASAGSLDVACAGVDSVLGRRFIRSTITHSATEQFDIAWSLINHTQGEPGGGLNITPATWTPSGVTRDRTYQPHELTVVAEALGAFRGLTDGFDWAIIPTAANAREWTPFYPSRGSLLEWQVGYGPNTRGNVESYTGYVTLDGPVTRAFVGGAGSGADRLIGSYADPGLGTTSLLMEGFKAGSTSMTDQATADDYAQNMVECATAPLTVVESVEVTGPLALVQSVRPGDTLPLRINHGWFQADGTYRVTSCKWGSDYDRVGLTLEPS